jgi:predicted kinase
MKEIDDLAAQVKANEDAEDSATLLVNGTAARFDAAIAAATSLSPADRAKLVALSADLKAHADALAAAVVANTPAASAAGA